MLNVRETSLDWALSHIEKYGDTDIFPVPFEFDAIRHDWDSVKDFLKVQDILAWKVRDHRALIAPKGRHGFRVVTQLDPLDSIMFLACIYEIVEELERSRVPLKNEVVFSYRIDTDANGQLFDPDIGYLDFLKKCSSIIEEDSGITFVVTTDISDFYSRIYHHRMVNALRSASTMSNHIFAVMHLLSGWNGTETFGIPIGNAPSRVLAEVTLNDVDQALLANGINFVRFNDDFRIFAKSHSEAYRNLAMLAETLFRNHGLNLQRQKTHILEVKEFKARYLETYFDREIHSLSQNFDKIVAELGLANRYEPIVFEDLTESHQEVVNSWNLQAILENEIVKSEPDEALIRFVIRRLGQLSDKSAVNILFDNLNVVHPSFPKMITYFNDLNNLNEVELRYIGRRLREAFQDSILSELEYHKMWCLELFTRSSNWGQQDEFVRLYATSRDDVSRRQLILAMGRAGQTHWFQSQWRSFLAFPQWSRRALLAAASCMPSDARRHWYKSIRPQLDVVEQAIVKWATQHPFS